MNSKLNKLLMSLFAGLCLLSCTNNEYRLDEGIAWNTTYHITYRSEKDLLDSVITVFNEIDCSLSPFNEESTVSKINHNRTQDVDLNFVAVYNESRLIHKASDGAFDPTLAPLIRAWGFGQGHEISATDTMRLDSLLKIVGIEKTSFQNSKIIKEDPEIEFNFSALAKGYGVDCIADMLERNGVKDYLVEVGGEIRAAGVNPQGKKWSIGIDRPEETSQTGQTARTIKISSGAIATSGNYRNFQKTEGSQYGHTISPKSGRPIQTDVISATVYAPLCIRADALATSCMVLGSNGALSLCNRLKAGVMLIKSDMSVIYNPYFEKLLDSLSD